MRQRCSAFRRPRLCRGRDPFLSSWSGVSRADSLPARRHERGSTCYPGRSCADDSAQRNVERVRPESARTRSETSSGTGGDPLRVAVVTPGETFVQPLVRFHVASIHSIAECSEANAQTGDTSARQAESLSDFRSTDGATCLRLMVTDWCNGAGHRGALQSCVNMETRDLR